MRAGGGSLPEKKKKSKKRRLERVGTFILTRGLSAQNNTTMNVNIQTVKFDADKRLVEFVEHKLGKMDRFAERSTGADVVLKLDKDFDKGNKVATITLHMPGSDLISEQRAKTFEEAIDLAIDALKRQNEKLKAQYAK